MKTFLVFFHPMLEKINFNFLRQIQRGILHSIDITRVAICSCKLWIANMNTKENIPWILKKFLQTENYCESNVFVKGSPKLNHLKQFYISLRVKFVFVSERWNGSRRGFDTVKAQIVEPDFNRLHRNKVGTQWTAAWKSVKIHGLLYPWKQEQSPE